MMGTEKIIKLHLCEKLQLKNKFLKIIVKAMCISGNWKIHCFNVFQTADKVKVSGQIFCKKPFQITRNMV